MSQPGPRAHHSGLPHTAASLPRDSLTNTLDRQPQFVEARALAATKLQEERVRRANNPRSSKYSRPRPRPKSSTEARKNSQAEGTEGGAETRSAHVVLQPTENNTAGASYSLRSRTRRTRSADRRAGSVELLNTSESHDRQHAPDDLSTGEPTAVVSPRLCPS